MNTTENTLTALSQEEKRHFLRQVVLGQLHTTVLVKEDKQTVEKQVPIDIADRLRALDMDNRMLAGDTTQSPEQTITSYRIIIDGEEFK